MTQFVIGSGQSNAKGGLGQEGGDLTINIHVKVWTDAGWQIAIPGQPPFHVSEPGEDARNNIMWNFCKKLQEETGEDVYFVLSGKGGTPISQWAEGSDQWENLDSAVHEALASPELIGVAEPDYFLWHQGEADTKNKNYAVDFLDMRQRAIDSGWLTETTKVIAGEILPNNEAKESMLDLIGSGAAPWLYLANHGDLDWIGLHPDAASAVTFGRERYWEAAQEQFNTLHDFFGADNFEFGCGVGETLYAIDNTLLRGAGGNDKIITHGTSFTLFGGAGYDVAHIYVDVDADVKKRESFIEIDGERSDLFGIEDVRVHYDL